MHSLFIIDYSVYAYKFKSIFTYAKQTINNVNIDLSVLAGFIRSLKSNMAKDIVIVIDGLPSRSIARLPSYKGQRLDDNFNNYIGVDKLEIVKFLTKIGTLLGKNIKVVCSPMQETDEVISSLVHHIVNKLPSKPDFQSLLNTRSINEDPILKIFASAQTSKYKPEGYDSVVISSTDGDFIQLQRFNNVYIDTSTSGKVISSERASKSTAQTNPAAAIFYKAICGDHSDNVPPIGATFFTHELISNLNKTIRTDEDVRDAYNAIENNIKGTKYDYLVDLVHPYFTEFKVNWDVTFLNFISYPLELTFPEYDINETIKKYSLRL